MGRAKVISAAERPDWYMVEDDLGTRYEVQSAVAGYAYQPGKEYRLFTPGGVYRTSGFRLLPQCGTRRWRHAGGTARRHRATAAAMWLYAGKWPRMLPQDRLRTVKEALGARLTFQDGGSANVPPEHVGLYRPGDTVAVVFGSPPSETATGNRAADFWVAGAAGDTPAISADAGCLGSLETWGGYYGVADLINGGGMPDQSKNKPGRHLFIKPAPGRNEMAYWYADMSRDYADTGFMYGCPATVSAQGTLTVRAGGYVENVTGDEFTRLRNYFKFPTSFPVYASTMSPAISITPPVTVWTHAANRLRCGGKDLKMSVDLATEDEFNGYHGSPSSLTGRRTLPGCMVLEFGDAPYPAYLDGKSINRRWYYEPFKTELFCSWREINMDSPFRLVYSAPGGRDFSGLSVPLASSGAPGQRGLKRPWPNRTADLDYNPYQYPPQRMAYNCPMDDGQTGFGNIGRLLGRVFDRSGEDITPALDDEYTGGIFPGYFEVERGPGIRDIYADFMAAYPFMENPEINPQRKLPRLSRVSFYAQGKGYLHEGPPLSISVYGSRVECRRLEFFY